ncbi:DUF4432 family protein [Ensifer soli]|uniref:DUF4432 family protein n=1 Tax=Ciceribacter sp. sgz301302 TaxID=3342379 RepID=UPI0035B6E08C
MAFTMSCGDVRADLDATSAFDIGRLAVECVALNPGPAIPPNGDARIDHALAGFLFTCGPDHIRHPEPFDGVPDGGRYPLHGSMAGTPASGIRADRSGDTFAAEVEVPLADGGRARVSRRYDRHSGAEAIGLSDCLRNTGATPFAPMVMYHLNLGGRLFDADTAFRGAMMPEGQLPWRFGEGERGLALFDARPAAIAGWAALSLGPFAILGGRWLHLRFDTATLPFLQMWRLQRGDADVVSIEPASHRIASRSELAAQGELVALAPGETVRYGLAFAFGAETLQDGPWR